MIKSCSIIDYTTVGNLEVESPGDGVPSVNTGLYLASQDVPFDGYVKASTLSMSY